jgi:hypothetical protein
VDFIRDMGGGCAGGVFGGGGEEKGGEEEGGGGEDWDGARLEVVKGSAEELRRVPVR